MKNLDECDWAVCIFSSREDSATLISTLLTCCNACLGKRSIIDIVINGNADLVDDIKNELKAKEYVNNELLMIRLWAIEESDKANAFNQYFHKIWPNSNLVFFVDGYVQPWPDSFSSIEKELLSADKALAATGVPTSGRSAAALRREMLSDGGIHGNLFALTKSAILKIREINFNLPLGVYRTDPIIGAALAFNFDPKNNSWNIKDRILVVSKASWNLPKKNNSIIKEVMIFCKRRIRQEKGKLENFAIKEQFTVFKNSPSDLPRNVNILISDWIDNNYKANCFFFLKYALAIYVNKKYDHIYVEDNLIARCID